MARKILKLYRVHASGVYIVPAESEKEAREKYREARYQIESADRCDELASIEADDEALSDEEATWILKHPPVEIEEEPEDILESPADTPERLIERALKRMNEREKGEAWALIRRFEMALKSRTK